MTADWPALFASGSGAVFLAGLVVYLSTNIDNMLLLCAVLGGKVQGWRLGVGAVGLSGLVVLCLTAGLAIIASGVPDLHLRWLGLIPILLGLRAGWFALRGDSASHAAAIGLLPISGLLLSNSSDTLAVFVPTLAETQAGLSLPLVLGFCCGVGFAAVSLCLLLRLPPLQAALAFVGPWLGPVIMILVGLYVVIDSPTDLI